MVKLSPGIDILTISGKKKIILKSEKYQSEKTIERVRNIQGKTVLKLSGVDSINDALKLVGYSVFGTADRDDSLSSLIGYDVIDMNGHPWGKVAGVREFGLNRVIEVDSRGDIIYIPLVKGIVPEIRDDQKLIVIDPPEGLENLNK